MEQLSQNLVYRALCVGMHLWWGEKTKKQTGHADHLTLILYITDYITEYS